MRIMYLHQFFRTPDQPGITRSYELARRLVQRGHEVHMITSDTEPRTGRAGWRVSEEAGITVHWARVPYANQMGYTRRVGAFGRFARVAATRAARLPQDVVFATSTPLTIALPAVYSARRNRVPMVFEVRDLWPEAPIAVDALRMPGARWAGWRLEAFAYRHANQVIALSPAMADSITGRFPNAAVTTIPNGCDLDLFNNADIPGKQLRADTPWLGNRPLVLYAGTLGLVNGVGYLVQLAASLRDTHPDVRFAIVGTGREHDHVRRLATRLQVLDRNVFMLGEVPKQQIPAWFGAATIALSTVIDQPALWANSANKVFDAFAASCPLGINHDGWIADLLRESGAGIVLSPTDLRAAALSLASFLYDEQRVAQARDAAWRLAAGRFSRDLLFRQFENVLLTAQAAGR